MSRRDFYLGVIVGAIIGSAVALLTTPKTGKEMREELNERLQQAREKGRNWVGEDLSNRISDVTNRVQEKWIEIKSAKKTEEEQSEVIHNEPSP